MGRHFVPPPGHSLLAQPRRDQLIEAGPSKRHISCSGIDSETASWLVRRCHRRRALHTLRPCAPPRTSLGATGSRSAALVTAQVARSVAPPPSARCVAGPYATSCWRAALSSAVRATRSSPKKRRSRIRMSIVSWPQSNARALPSVLLAWFRSGCSKVSHRAESWSRNTRKFRARYAGNRTLLRYPAALTTKRTPAACALRALRAGVACW